MWSGEPDRDRGWHNRNRKFELILSRTEPEEFEAPGVGQITRLVSTGLLKLLPALHIRPIKQLVSLQSYPRTESGREALSWGMLRA